MSRAPAGLTLTLIVVFSSSFAAQRPVQRPALPGPAVASVYFPDRFDWQHKNPADVGMDAARLDGAGRFAIPSETAGARDLTLLVATNLRCNQAFGTAIRP